MQKCALVVYKVSIKLIDLRLACISTVRITQLMNEPTLTIVICLEMVNIGKPISIIY